MSQDTYSPEIPSELGWYWTRTPDGDERMFEIIRRPRGTYRAKEDGTPAVPEADGLAIVILPDEEPDGVALDAFAVQGWEYRGPVAGPDADPSDILDDDEARKVVVGRALRMKQRVEELDAAGVRIEDGVR